jgi:hypothetical protein
MRSNSLAATLSLVLLVGLAAPAHADEARDQSRAAFRRGVAAAKERDFATARDAFTEAYRLFPHPSILLNLGIARARTGELVDAEQDLVKFIADDGGATPEEMKSAQRTLADVKDKLGTIALDVKPAEAKATLDGKPLVLLAGRTTPVRAIGGQHTLKVEAEGYAPSEQKVEVVSKIESPLKVELVSTRPQGEGAGPAVSSEGIPRATVGWVLMGVGVAAAGAGAYFGVTALSLASEYNDKSKQPDPDKKAKGERYRTYADIAFGGALLAGAAGAYFLLVKPKPSAPQAGIVVSPSYAGVRGTF